MPFLDSTHAQILKELGRRIKFERVAQNITQRDFATHSGVSYATLRLIESSGKGSMGDYVLLLISLNRISALEHFLPSTPSIASSDRVRLRAAKPAHTYKHKPIQTTTVTPTLGDSL